MDDVEPVYKGRAGSAVGSSSAFDRSLEEKTTHGGRDWDDSGRARSVNDACGWSGDLSELR